jgi:hypothetical protein
MRALTVSRLHRESGPLHRRAHSVVPSIRLNGSWLDALGFKVGERVLVTVENGALRITKGAAK